MADRTVEQIDVEIAEARAALREAVTSPASVGSRRGQVQNRSIAELRQYLNDLLEERAAVAAAAGSGPAPGVAYVKFEGV
jgi:hypothetical protein